MFFTIELSCPVQWKPGFYRCKGMTIFRVWWLFFAVSLHPMRLDEMIDLASNDVAKWDDTPNAQDGFADEIAERAYARGTKPAPAEHRSMD